MRDHQENTPPAQENIEAEEDAHARQTIFVQVDILASITEEEEDVEDEMSEFDGGKNFYSSD